MIKGIFTAICILTFSFLAAGNQKSDSLSVEISKTIHPIKKASLQLDYCWEVKYTHLNEAIATTVKVLDILEKAKAQEEVAKGYSYLGVFKYLQDSIPIAINYLEKAEQMLLKQDNPKLLSRVYNNLGVCHSALFDNEMALEFYRKGLSIKQKQKGDIDISSNLINISGILYDQGKYTECIEVNEQALIYALKNDDLEAIAVIYSNIGASYERLGDYKKSINFTLQALEIYHDKLKNTGAEARTYSNLGASYLSQKMYTEARFYFSMALDLNKKINHKSNLAVSYNNMAEVERVSNNLTIALDYANTALSIAKLINNKEEKRISYHVLSLIYEDKGDFKSSLSNYKKYVQINDTITSQNQTTELEKSLAQNKIELQKVQEELKKETTVVFDKKINIMNGIIVSFITFQLMWFLIFILKINPGEKIVYILNYLNPVLFSASAVMYFLLVSDYAKTFSTLQNFIVIFSVLIIGIFIHLQLTKQSSLHIINDRD